MYDLEKIIVLSNWDLEDREALQTVVMKTHGLKIENILYLCDINATGGDKKKVKKELKDELYLDQYDDDLTIKVKEVVNGEHAVIEIAKFINKIWNPDTLLFFYDDNQSVFEKLEKELLSKNGSIYLSDYYDIFTEKREIEKDIFTIMEEQGLKMNNLIKESQLSFIYFLSALVEKILSK